MERREATAAAFDTLRTDVASLVETAAETAETLAAGEPVVSTATGPLGPTDRFLTQLESIQQRLESHIHRLEDEMTVMPHTGSLYGEEKDLELARQAAAARPPAE